eukprot:5875331-Lingulodinium_polyedra.AAC.1
MASLGPAPAMQRNRRLGLAGQGSSMPRRRPSRLVSVCCPPGAPAPPRPSSLSGYCDPLGR